jgi:fermentation-respiration switch protein FrsA (DUF1100 family)
MLLRDFTLDVDGLKISARLYLPPGDMPYPTVCICHGIPSGIPAPDDGGYPLLAEQVCSQGFGVLIFNFRGAGASGGNLDILGWSRDLTAAVDYLCALPEVAKSRLCLLGFSAGAAVSIYVASSDNRVSSVAACACPAQFTRLDGPESLIDHYRSIGAIRDAKFPPSIDEWFNGFKQVKPIDYVARISPRPLLLVHGSQDELVDVGQAYKLYERAGEPKKLVIIDGAKHRLRQNNEAMAVVLEWLKSHN